MTKTTQLLSLLIALSFPWQWDAGAQPSADQPLPSGPCLWRNVVIGGGGFVTGIIVHPTERGLMYARTDVGGAYRWDAAAQKWAPITDWIGAADDNLFGIESIGVDARDPNRVYLAAGTYGRGNAAILRSDDRGQTFQRTDVPFKMGGNENGRFNGERLAVDPNLGTILFFGTRRDGLWKSTDRGAHWAKVESFPDVKQLSQASETSSGGARADFGFGRQQPVGVMAVVLDPSSGQPGAATPVVYAAFSGNGTNLFVSRDAGQSWAAVTNEPIGLRPIHLVRALDGIFYVTYGREPGPSAMTDGAVWKFNPKDGAWTDITPVKPKEPMQRFGYGGIAVDAQHPSTVMVSTFNHWDPRDEIFRSTNGGASWKRLMGGAVWDHSYAPYTKPLTPHWIGEVQINPFDSDQVYFTTGYGIWACTNATAADAGQATHWVFLDQGLEETVPWVLLSPPEGAHLLSGVADVDGFRHDDLNASPAKGAFTGPRFGGTEDLAFAGKNPSLIVRTGVGGRRATVHAAISEDGGETWKLLASDLPGARGGGSIALSADGKTIVWTPRREAPSASVDRGTSWAACAGLESGSRVIADPVNAARFYAFDPRAGTVLASSNGAVTFAPTGASFAPAQGERGFGQGNAILHATPGLEGDLWLAFRNNGLAHSTNGGTNFVKIERGEGADAFGFGKAAPGKSFPALYLAGNVGRLQGLFRSDDVGQSWVRIDDDRHRFGRIGYLTGDPRVYGRVYLATGGRGVVYGDRAVDSREAK
jgi:photosystem II stability/assembly factor-like uncharacterized protein